MSRTYRHDVKRGGFAYRLFQDLREALFDSKYMENKLIYMQSFCWYKFKNKILI